MRAIATRGGFQPTPDAQAGRLCRARSSSDRPQGWGSGTCPSATIAAVRLILRGCRAPTGTAGPTAASCGPAARRPTPRRRSARPGRRERERERPIVEGDGARPAVPPARREARSSTGAPRRRGPSRRLGARCGSRTSSAACPRRYADGRTGGDRACPIPGTSSVYLFDIARKPRGRRRGEPCPKRRSCSRRGT